jgi:hypothetical protein
VRQFSALSLIGLFTLAMAMSLAHLASEQQTNCIESSPHFCAEDNHHHISLSSVVLNLGYFSEPNPIIYPIAWERDTEISILESAGTFQPLSILSRGPPAV